MKNLRHILSALGLALVMTGNAQAILLTELFAGGSITAGDKLFDQWNLIYQDSSEVGRTVNTDNIEVTALNDGGLDPGPGLQFDILNNEFSVTGDDLYAYLDFTFGFRVSVLDPNLRIKDSALELGSLTLGYEDDGFNNLGIYIQEQVGTAPGLDDLAIKDVTVNILDGELVDDRSDLAVFPPQSQIFVTKNILVWTQDSTDFFSPNRFTQRFSQTTVPEPGTWGLLALGCAGLICLGRKRGYY